MPPESTAESWWAEREAYRMWVHERHSRVDPIKQAVKAWVDDAYYRCVCSHEDELHNNRAAACAHPDCNCVRYERKSRESD